MISIIIPGVGMRVGFSLAMASPHICVAPDLSRVASMLLRLRARVRSDREIAALAILRFHRQPLLAASAGKESRA